jgi:hypothetical protein
VNYFLDSSTKEKIGEGRKKNMKEEKKAQAKKAS